MNAFELVCVAVNSSRSTLPGHAVPVVYSQRDKVTTTDAARVTASLTILHTLRIHNESVGFLMISFSIEGGYYTFKLALQSI